MWPFTDEPLLPLHHLRPLRPVTNPPPPQKTPRQGVKPVILPDAGLERFWVNLTRLLMWRPFIRNSTPLLPRPRRLSIAKHTCHQDTLTPSLFSLPYEIRHEVYRYVLGGHNIVLTLGWRNERDARNGDIVAQRPGLFGAIHKFYPADQESLAIRWEEIAVCASAKTRPAHFLALLHSCRAVYGSTSSTYYQH
ncbi:hypothetical protein BDZ85DRAFT_301216 [Elsinoe ampelina]|uniref:DUF7730 domain-containing protein n=1 Tax=Elsinoe ampelina TaxID=302913 RepID=A0A6A6GRI3_9PEZI|nr:hypothetical protein BDZ85DRAFT_301216 [Elsinoe ampelina]